MEQDAWNWHDRLANDAIAAGRGQEIMLLQEALMEQKIGNLAAQIASDDKRNLS